VDEGKVARRVCVVISSSEDGGPPSEGEGGASDWRRCKTLPIIDEDDGVS
jgi:hypothetical protein